MTERIGVRLARTRTSSSAALPNGSRFSCGRPARRRKAVRRQSVPPQGHNTPLPLRRSPPASYKRLLGSARNRR